MELKIFFKISSSGFLVPLPLIPFTTEEVTVCTNEAAKGITNKAGINPSFLFFVSVFTVLVITSTNIFESSIDFMILIISFISSFEINKAIPLLALAVSFPLIFLSNVFIAFEAQLYTNPILS